MAHDQRSAVRIDCDLPVRLQGARGAIDAQMVDVSRVGLRLRIPGAALSVHRLSSLAQISRNLTEILGDVYEAALHTEMLGSLLSKHMTTTRIAKRDWEHPDVEIGCAFAQTLTDDEVGMLGVPLPPIGDRRGVARDAAPAPRIREGRTDPRTAAVALRSEFSAFIYPSPGKSAQPLLTRTTSLSRGMAYVEVERMGGWELEQLDLSELVVALDDAYGSNVLLRIVEDGHDLWAGPAEIKEVDVTPSPKGIRLGVAFGRELRSEELERLRVPGPA